MNARVRQSSLAVLIGIAIAAPFCFHLLRDPDTGWHFALGRQIAASGIPFRNTLAWTAANQPWYATSWLYDWTAAEVVGRFGLIGLQIFTLAFVAATIGGIAAACARVNPRFGAWLAPLAGLIIIPRISERPHMASFVLLAMVLWLCAPDGHARAHWRRRLWCVPLIALGSNFHAGAAFPAAALGFFCVEAFLLGDRNWREAAIAIGGVLALIANPGGAFIARYLLDNFHHADVISVAEMAAPTSTTAPDFFVALPIGLIAAAWTAKRSPALLATTIVFALLGLKAIRLAWDYELVAAVALANALADFKGGWRYAIPAAATLALGALRLPMYQTLPIGHEFDAQVLPVRAVEFVHRETLPGRPYNAIGDGGYLEWALPEWRWFQDSRAQAFPPEFFREEQMAEKSADTLRKWVADRGAEFAIASRLGQRMSGYMQFESPEWALVYWDETSEVWLRRDVPALAPLIARLEYRHFRPQAPVTVVSAKAPELISWESELTRFEETAPDYPAAAVLHCAVQRRLGANSAQACDHAERLANTVELRQAFERVKNLPQAG